MKTSIEDEDSREKEWPIPPYYKCELAEAYAPNLSSGSALNRLAQWIKITYSSAKHCFRAVINPVSKCSLPCRWS